MADITQTVDGMPISQLKPKQPEPPEPKPRPTLTKKQIEDVAKDLVRPWIHGDNLQRIGKKHGVKLLETKKIWAAVKNRLKEEG